MNVSWHLAYPHKGGFRLEVLDPKDRPIRDLTPVSKDGNKYITGDPTAQFYEVELPNDLTCIDCSIRLVRQASEWGKKYQFWSCADVDILPKNEPFVNICSGHGKSYSGRCRCDRNFYGDFCQFRDECIKDEDCGIHGKCHDIMSTSAPRKQCFCREGWHGKKCSKPNPKVLAKKKFQEGLYTKKELSDKMTIYWRLLKGIQEIEIVMKAKTTSWVALGWRPKGQSASCKKFPVLADQEQVARSLDLQYPGGDHDDQVAEPEPDSEPEGDHEEDIESEAEAEAEAEPSQSAQPQPRDSRSKKIHKRRTSVSTRTDVGISFVSMSVSGKRSRRSPVDRSLYTPRYPRAFAIPLRDDDEDEVEENAPTSAEPEAESSPETEPESEPETEVEPEAEAESEPEAEAESEPEPEAESEAEPEAEPAVAGGTSWTPRGDFHAMDCTDIVIGSARGNTARVYDYYTRDRSTPLRDHMYEGEDDITASIGWEEDGETTIIFRKKMVANGPTDHSILNDNMHVIWAVGQKQGEYSHSPHSGLESSTEEASVPNFYHDDELKYHGKENRGISSINFHDEIKLALNDQSELDYCGGEWKYPRSCKSEQEDCEYVARWQYDENTDIMNFTVSSRNPDKKSKWTGIGFSNNPQMRLTDVVIGWVEIDTGRPFIMDMWTTTYLQPALDPRQDIFDKSGKLENGVTTISFSRKRDTGDKQDIAFTDTEDRYMIFPIKGGGYNGVNKKLYKHEEVPIASSERIFIKSCRTADGKPTFTTTPKPPQLMVTAEVKFVDLKNFNLPRERTQDYEDLQAQISRSLRQTELKSVPGFLDVQVINFYSEQKGEFEAKFMVVVDETEFESANDPLTVETALKNSVALKRIGGYPVDPGSLVVGETRTTYNEDKAADSSIEANPNVKLYVVVACIAALVVVAIIQASCTIFKMTRRGSSVQKEKLLGQNQWKDYSGPMGPTPGQVPAPHHNYGYDAFETEDPKMGGWHHQPPPSRHNYERYAARGAPTHSLPRGSHVSQHQPSAYPMGYSSYDRRSGGGSQLSSRPTPGHSDYPPPDHYFMPSQRKYSEHGHRM